MKTQTVFSVLVCISYHVLMTSAHSKRNKYSTVRLEIGETIRTFPENFKFGVSTSAYQIEGAWNVSDKTESIWDRMTHTPGKISDNTTGDVACDSYHLYKRDVEMVKEMNLDFYRFSISWNRLLPRAWNSKISVDGLRYYNDLIDEIIRQGITPHVTLYHFDLPQVLQDIGGWKVPVIADFFEEFAEVAFDKFGDRVKHWVTFNEPLTFCFLGYGTGVDAPGINDTGNADYKCGHNVLRAHAKAYRLYKSKAKTEPEKYNGKVSIVLNGNWYQPKSDLFSDIDIADTVLQFETGWFAHPIFVGNYPPKMIEKIDGGRLPKFTDEELIAIKGSVDYLGINHYTSNIIRFNENNHPKPSTFNDIGGFKSYQSDEWPKARPLWLSVTPWGFKNYLTWLMRHFGNPEIVVYENGYSGDDGLDDPKRLDYIHQYLHALLDAIDNGVNVTGYGVWSLMDNFEWSSGFSERFGLYHVDFTKPDLPRTRRNSGKVFAEIAKTKSIAEIKIPLTITIKVQSSN